MSEKDIILKISDGYSTQSKIANQFWLILVIYCIITLLATGSQANKNLIELPFSLGKVKTFDFYQLNIILISILSISFTSAMIQVIRTRKLIQKMIDGLTDKNIISNIHIQDYLDSTFSPTYNRVAPISQYLLGKNQFFNEGTPNKFIKNISSIFYVLLKLTTFVVLYFLPFFSLYRCWSFILKNQHSDSEILIYTWVLIFVTLMAFISIVILFVGDLKYLRIVLKRLL